MNMKKIVFISCLLVTSLSTHSLWAEDDYAVVKDGIITFYFDNNKDSHEGTIYEVAKELEFGLPSWADGNLKTAVFDESFSNYRLTSTYGMFGNCTGLIEVKGLSNLNTSEVTNMNQMFAKCSSLEIIDLASLNTGNVKSMDWMFYSCEKLTVLDLSNFDTQKVESMSQMFAGCSNITKIDISGFITSSVSNMYKMFSSCNHLKTIYADDNWTTINVTNSKDMFNLCFNLVGGNGTKCDGYGFTTPTDHSYARIDTEETPGYFTYKGSSISVSGAYAVENEGVLTFYYDENKTSHSGILYEIATDYVSNGSYPAWQSSNITKVIFDKSFLDYSPTSTARWFHSCSGINEIENINYLNTSAVKDMRAMFYGCNSLKTLNTELFNTENVTNMYCMFYNCSSLEDLDLSSIDTNKVTSMVAMFYGCTGLKNLNVFGFDTNNVEDMQYMFFNCSSLTTLDLSSFNTSKVTNMDAMFANCSSIETIYASDEWSIDNVQSGDFTFSNCYNLVGGNGTKYDLITNYLYAKIDEENSPGYFTYKNMNGISNIYDYKTNGTTRWFTIDGIMHTTSQKGINILNKKKILVK